MSFIAFNIYFIIIPVLSAITGWLINYLVARYFIKKIPAKQAQLAAAISRQADSYINTQLNIENKIANPALINNVMPLVETHVDEFLNVKLAQEIPMLSMFIGTKTTDKIKDVFMKQLQALFPVMMKNIVTPLKKELDVVPLLHKKIMEIDMPLLLQQQGITGKMAILGLVAGFIIGVINVLVIFIF